MEKHLQKNAILSLWQTDLKGFYIAGAGEEHRRIHGRMKTGSDGKYEFQTIRPVRYQQSLTSAKPHYQKTEGFLS